MSLRLKLLIANKFRYLFAYIYLPCLFVFTLIMVDMHAQVSNNGTKTKRAITITGTVTSSDDDLGLPGVNILIKGTSQGTITDISGNYEIEVPSGESILIFSSVGYLQSEELVGDRKIIDVVLQVNVENLDDIVVIGYGTTTKKETTGSISTIKSEDFNKGDISNPIGLIQGKVPGLTIIKSGGSNPNEGYQIQLRGLNTLSGGKSPLIIVDGSISNNTLDMINPNEIESIDVLKDGSAAAIYGTRATNGVILITTKKPQEGKVQYEYATYYSTEIPSEKSRFLTAGEYRNILNDYYPNLASSLDKGASTDWFDEVTRTPLNMYQSFTISGGAPNIQYRANLYYKDDQGIVKNTRAQTVTPSLFLSTTGLNNKLKVDVKLMYSNVTRKGGNDNVIFQALQRNPTEPVYNEADEDNGGYYTVSTSTNYLNPVAMINERNNDTEEQLVNSDLSASYSIFEGLKLSLHASYNRFQNNYGDYLTRYYPNVGTNGYATVSTYHSNNILIEPALEYTKDIKKHKIQTIAGYSYYSNVEQEFSAENYNFDTDDFSYNNLSSGNALTEGTASMETSKESNKLISFFGRVMYNFNDKYLLSTSVRYEGSSRFGDNNKWGIFPAVSFGWRITEEEFARNLSWLSNLKLRAGYGVTGNQDIPNYQSISTMSVSRRKMYYNGSWVNTYAPSSNPNPDLRWERKGEYNVGLDYGLFKDKITGTVDYYYRKISDLLWWYAVPVPPNVYSSTYANVGDIVNKGVEFSITGNIINQSNVSWTSTLNFSRNTNELVSFSNEEEGYELEYLQINPLQSTWTELVTEGEPIGNFMAPIYLGADENGNAIYKDVNGDGAVDVESIEDREVVGNAYPDFELGWSNQVRFKKFDLSFTFRGVFGQSLLNYERAYFESWMPLVSGCNILNSTLDYADYTGIQTYDSRYVEKASYVKLDNITLGYTTKIGENKQLRVYLSGQNLVTFTNYKGSDPERTIGEFNTYTETDGSGNLNYYPYTRSFSIGLNFNF